MDTKVLFTLRILDGRNRLIKIYVIYTTNRSRFPGILDGKGV